MTKHKIETIAIQAGRDADLRIGAVMPPIHLTTTFVRDNEGGFVYSRTGNPNRDALEACLTALEEGAGAIAFGSGMGAIHAALMSLLAAGDRIVYSSASDPLGTNLESNPEIFMIETATVTTTEGRGWLGKTWLRGATPRLTWR